MRVVVYPLDYPDRPSRAYRAAVVQPFGSFLRLSQAVTELDNPADQRTIYLSSAAVQRIEVYR